MAGALAGGAIGSYLNLSGRQIGFFVLLGVGAALLISLNRPKKKPVVLLPAQTNAPESENFRHREVASSDRGDLVSDGIATPRFSEARNDGYDKVLTKEEARQWLDDFLIKQQKTK